MTMSKIHRATPDFRLNPLTIAIAVALAVPGAAVGEPMLLVPLTRGADMTRYDSNYVELGVGYNSEDSYKFGEFSGLYKDGAFLIGNANVRKRFGESTGYVNAYGYNLGLPSRQLFGEVGQQGRYWVNAGLDQLTRYQYDDTQFIHSGLGGSLLTLPPGAGGFAQPTTGAAQINPFLQTFTIKQERDVWKFGGGFFLGPEWKFSLDYRQDNFDGNKLIGSVMGNTGGNPRAAILPYELNAKTQQVEAVASWTGKQGQLNLSYWYSKYSNDATSLTWQNPYTLAAGWGAGTGFPTGYGRLGLMPDNDFHQIMASGGWNFNKAWRMTGTLAYSVMTQDDSYLPYTIMGPAFPGGPAQPPGSNVLTVPTALPRNSLDGKIENTLFDWSLIGKPFAKTTLKLNYRYNKHDNKTPQDWYSYVGGDTIAQTPIPPGTNPETIASPRIRRNLPPGTIENRFKVDADYEVFNRTLLRGFYSWGQTEYEEASEELRTRATNNTLGAELRRIMSETFTGSLRYAYVQRRGSGYDNNAPYTATYTNAQTAAVPVENITTLRHFFVADYDRNLITVTGTWSPAERLSLGLRADLYGVDYKGPDCGGAADQVLAPAATFPAECLGRTKADGQSYTVDASWMPQDNWTTFAFFTYQQYSTDQLSRSQNGTAAQQTSTARDWSAKMDFSDYTFGVGLNFKPPSTKYDFGAQYVMSQGTGEYSLGAASNAPAGVGPVTPVPDTKTRLDSLQLYGKYQYSKNVLFRLNYAYERYRGDDWAYDGATATSSQNVLLTGQQTPRYSANVFGFSVAYTGW
jgi:MtrB/PioB family decaheme-associated outer membrane protein